MSPARPPAAADLEQARALAARLAPTAPTEAVALADLPGRRLAETVTARAPVPPFTNSAMDGYAVRAADTPGALRLRGESAAGRPGAGALSPGETWRISTGAPLPPGADAVVRQEDARVEADLIHIAQPISPGNDVRHAGEDLAAGAPVLPAGHIVTPHEVGVIAAAGHARVACHARITVAVLATGDELAEPGTSLGDGVIYESNTHGICAQARAAGARIGAVVRVGDNRPATEDAVRELLGGDEPPTLLVTLGGLSVGPHDHIRPALAAAGVQLHMHRLRMRPGQPTAIGTRDGQVVLALPGNPVSAAICFHLFGRTLLGAPPRWNLRLPLTVPLTKRPGLAQIVRCRIGPDGLTPLAHQGSAAVSSLALVDALALAPADAGDLPAGTMLSASHL
ncbi:MAG TPA: molybdopterin molybdotransferase MoeA [Miltoncostaeaceae bacterium]|nr:molybdopterin molybdotransferase MoeA [Miltoncostaeaceae bacterium]